MNICSQIIDTEEFTSKIPNTVLQIIRSNAYDDETKEFYNKFGYKFQLRIGSETQINYFTYEESEK